MCILHVFDRSRHGCRLLGQIVAKCIIDNRLVDIQQGTELEPRMAALRLHPAFWRSVLGATRVSEAHVSASGTAPLSQESLRAVDPEARSQGSGIGAEQPLSCLESAFLPVVFIAGEHP